VHSRGDYSEGRQPLIDSLALLHLDRALADLRAARASAEIWDERPLGTLAGLFRAELEVHEARRIARGESHVNSKESY
jgi:hypothetical protein